jgi:hypothetical protein
MKRQETWPRSVHEDVIITLQVKLAMPGALHPRRVPLPVDVALRRGSNPLGCALAHDPRREVAR